MEPYGGWSHRGDVADDRRTCRRSKIRVTREGFDRLSQNVAQLAEAQALAERQLELLAAQVDQLAQAQVRTELALQQLATQVGALSENIGYGLEDIARLVLPGYLKHRYGIHVQTLERKQLQVDGRQIEVDLYGEGKRGRQPVVVLGEVKSRIYGRQVNQFVRDLGAVRAEVGAKVVPLMFGYFKVEGVLLIASYQPTVEMQSAKRSSHKRKRDR
jgi:hypothetical protein